MARKKLDNFTLTGDTVQFIELIGIVDDSSIDESMDYIHA